MMEIPTSLIKHSIRRGTIIHSYGFTDIDHGKFFVVVGISDDCLVGFEKRELAADIAEGTASIVGEMQAVHLSELLSATRESDLFTDYEKATYLRE